MTIRDKKRQNYRELCEKYLLGDDNILYIKLKSKNNEIEKYRIPYESEKYLYSTNFMILTVIFHIKDY